MQMKTLQHGDEVTKIIDSIYIICTIVAVSGFENLQAFHSKLSTI